MKKVSQWLEEMDSHAIYNAELCAKDFKKETGLEPCWPVHTVRSCAKHIQARSLGGDVRGDPEEKVCYGYEIANALAETLANSYAHRRFHGRGSQFDCAIQVLREVKC